MTKVLKTKESISENIANLLNSAPTGFHDDEEFDDTSAKVLNEENENFEEITEISKIRAKNAPLLENLDEKYAGKVASRKIYNEFSGDDESEEGSENDSNVVDEDDDDEDEAEDDDDEEEAEEEEIEEFESEESEEENNTNFKTFKETDSSAQKQKGMSVRNQLSLWENLLEIRIQLQKCLAASNRLPTEQNFTQLQKQSEDYDKTLKDTKKNVTNALNKMVDLQKILLQKYPETKKILTEKQLGNKEDDEEITSESEAESEIESEPTPKKRKIHEFEELISKRHNLYKNYRNNTIQKWNDKTRIGTLSKNTKSHSILNQIEHILVNKSKLIKKSQLKRSNYQIIGEEESEDGDEIYNENIYDDDDFYHQLLKELIEFKSSDVTDPIQLGRQWIQLQNMRSKMKRKIDTRATKGRKIRYAVHTKLVNFMAPIDYRNTWTEEAKNELFGSLFGKKQL